MKLLSYELSPQTPTFLDNPPVVFRQVSSILDGEASNWYEITTINHNGTHIDAPFHFWQDGAKLTDFTINDFLFERPLLIDIPKGDGQLIHARDLAPYERQFRDTDLLLIRTGAGSYRNTDPIRYGRRSPGFHPDAADTLLSLTSNLRALAFDFPSAASPMRLAEGIEFHQEVLGTTGRERFLFLIEDARLDAALRQGDIRRVLVVPLFLTGLDAAPCTVIAEP